MSTTDELTFAQQLELFQRRTGDQRFQGLIVLGTELHNTVAALLIGALRPRRVAFLLTPETSAFARHIAATLGVSPDDWETPEREHRDTTDVYRSVKELRERWSEIGDPAQIAVDVTGGLKPMSIGLEKAAHVLGLTTIYVQSDYWPKESGRRGIVQGSQRLVIPPDPYTVFGDLEAREAQLLYAAHDYQGARRILDALARRVGGGEGARYRAHAALAEAYAAWDAFDLTMAERMLDLLLAAAGDAQLGALRPALTAQAEGLAAINRLGQRLYAQGGPPAGALRDTSFILALFGSLYANTLRREQQGRLDVAALLRYRSLELMSQHRLAHYGVMTERADLSQLAAERPELDQRYRAAERAAGFEPRGLLRTDSLTLLNGYMLLSALEDQLTVGLDLRQLRQQVRVRNTSILAHGYRLIGPAEYAAFATLVEGVMAQFFALSGHDRSAWEQRYRFVDLQMEGSDG